MGERRGRGDSDWEGEGKWADKICDDTSGVGRNEIMSCWWSCVSLEEATFTMFIHYFGVGQVGNCFTSQLISYSSSQCQHQRKHNARSGHPTSNATIFPKFITSFSMADSGTPAVLLHTTTRRARWRWMYLSPDLA